MSNAAIETEKWYMHSAERLKQQFLKVGFRSDLSDPVRGGFAIELELSHLTASIVIWSKGDISVYVLREGSQDPFPLADRVLNHDENISLLLDRYVEEILKCGKKAGRPR
jgi:hypothetical protein